VELVEKLDYFKPEKSEEMSLYNLKKIGTDIRDVQKKQLEKESKIKELVSLNKKSKYY